MQTQRQQIEVNRTDRLGQFSRTGLAPGEYTISVNAEGSGGHVVDVNVSIENEEVDIDLARSTQ